MLVSFLPASRRKPLAACVAAMFALAAPETVVANTWTVANCADSGSGSLRAVLGNIATLSGDIIDMAGLTCSTISLTTGAVTVAQSSLTLNGPGINALTITRDPSGPQDRILTHSGTGGTLALNNLSISSGYLFLYGDANGGCISSSGSVSLDHVRVSSCTAKSNYNVRGGGIYTFASLTMAHSILDGNSATNTGSTTYVEGGGAEVRGDFSASYSTISNNQVVAFVGTTGFGGGLQLRNNVTITNSTISGNSASRSAGAIRISSPTPARVDIIDSTISGNSATNNIVGGILSTAGTVHLYNSTIAFNTAFNIVSNFSPGLALNSDAGTILATLQSSVLANNTYGTVDNDLSTAGANTITVLGANNLVRAHQFSGSTTVTVNLIATTTCPLLGPLRDNGGPTQTHALLSHSPGIDQGNNSRMPALSNDQRGPPYLRVSGTIADIGAYEVQQGEIIFNNDFEGCP